MNQLQLENANNISTGLGVTLTITTVKQHIHAIICLFLILHLQ